MCKVFEDVREEGRVEGAKKRAKEMVQRMIASGKYTLEEITSISGLPLEEVEQLRAEHNA